MQKKNSEIITSRQQDIDEYKKKHGRYHEKTLQARYMLGLTLLEAGEYRKAELSLEKTISRQVYTLGRDHDATISSKSLLGDTLSKQKKYTEAESMIRQAIDSWEKKYGLEGPLTHTAKKKLIDLFEDQDKASKAEEYSRRELVRYETELGKENNTTIDMVVLLASALRGQHKFAESRDTFQRAINVQASKFGKDDERVLQNRYSMGYACFWLCEYSQAEECFREAAEGFERMRGRDYYHTIENKSWLGWCLCKQQRLTEAERILQSALKDSERVLGKSHYQTIMSKYWLDTTLYDLKRLVEAEGPLRRATEGLEKESCVSTNEELDNDLDLARPLNLPEQFREAAVISRGIPVEFCLQTPDNKNSMSLQEIRREAETILRQNLACESSIESKDQTKIIFATQTSQDPCLEPIRALSTDRIGQQTVNEEEELSEESHSDTLGIAKRLQGPQLNHFPSLLMVETAQQTSTDRLDNFFTKRQQDRNAYTDNEITEISLLLKSSHAQWSKTPRTYIVLRYIGSLDLLDKLVDSGFSDYWFPVTEQTLPEFFQPNVRAAFLSAQSLVLTKSVDLEKGDMGRHCHFRNGDPLPFEPKRVLGRGGFGQVDEVTSTVSNKIYARKRVLRNAAFRGRKNEGLKRFIGEIKILKRLKHEHIVQFVGSYTDPKYIGLIMSPVADMDLGVYLTCTTTSNRPELRTFFGCLATALVFLHGQNVRHKDIKPGNILVSGGIVLFTDFGLSLDFKDADGSTTVGMVNALSRRYCAPEVIESEPRNRKSDIWSLGIVFMEMMIVLKGKKIRDMDEFFAQRETHSIFLRNNLAILPDFIAELKSSGEPSDNTAFGWIQKMLSLEHHLRPSAASVVTSISAPDEQGRNTRFLGICCVSSEEDFSDFSDN